MSGRGELECGRVRIGNGSDSIGDPNVGGSRHGSIRDTQIPIGGTIGGAEETKPENSFEAENRMVSFDDNFVVIHRRR